MSGKTRSCAVLASRVTPKHRNAVRTTAQRLPRAASTICQSMSSWTHVGRSVFSILLHLSLLQSSHCSLTYVVDMHIKYNINRPTHGTRSPYVRYHARGNTNRPFSERAVVFARWTRIAVSWRGRSRTSSPDAAATGKTFHAHCCRDRRWTR